MSTLLKKLEAIYMRFQEIGEQIVDPEIIADMKRYVKLNKEYKDLEEIVEAYKKYKNVLENIASSKEMLKTETDKDFVDMAKAEIEALYDEQEQLEESIKFLLIPKDEEDTKNVIIEIRAGTGGDEASIFVGDLFKMYSRYIEKRGWKMEVLTVNEGTMGGYKEISFSVEGED